MKHTEETKRKISEANKGKESWNKGKSGCFSKETIERMSLKRKGVKHSSKLTEEIVSEIRALFDSRPSIEGVGEVQRNGRKMSYMQAFCKRYSDNYEVTPACLKRIILRQTWK